MGRSLHHVGFWFETDEEYWEAIERLANEATQRVSTPSGDYAIWKSPSGAALWFQVEGRRRHDGSLQNGHIVGLEAFLETDSHVNLRIDRTFRRPDESALIGSVVARFDPERTGEANGYPIVFDAIDFAAQGHRRPGATYPVRLICFPRAMAVFADVVAFQKAGSETAGLSPYGFVATGLSADPEQPSAHAQISGMVVRHARMLNEVTNRAFDRITVASDGAYYDLLMDASTVPAKMRPGVFISSVCWMVGRFLGDH